MLKPTLSLNDKGFSLIEVMIAMVVLTIGLLGLLQAVNVSMEHNLKNSLRDNAVIVGEQQMNILLNLGFNAIQDTTYGQYTTIGLRAGRSQRITQ